MIEKKTARKNLCEMRWDLANQITSLRKAKKLTIEELGFETGIKQRYIEKLELAQLEVNLGLLNALARFFDKKIKIELID